MSKNTRFIILAIIFALIIAIIMMPQKPAETPMTATPANGLSDETTAPAAGETPAPAAEMPATDATGDVDGVPAGTEVTGDAATQAPDATTPAPMEATPEAQDAAPAEAAPADAAPAPAPAQ